MLTLFTYANMYSFPQDVFGNISYRSLNFSNTKIRVYWELRSLCLRTEENTNMDNKDIKIHGSSQVLLHVLSFSASLINQDLKETIFKNQVEEKQIIWEINERSDEKARGRKKKKSFVGVEAKVLLLKLLWR